MDSKSIPLGPEVPLTKLTHSAKSMFLSLLDRIPSRDNPAYPEYCKTAGIEVDEENELILLSTIGRRGPSSFIFEPVIEELSFDLRAFRNELELSIRDFATAFGISFATVQRIESGKVSGREVLKRVELYKRFPEAALFELERNRTRLHRATYERTLTRLSDTNGSKQ